MVKVDNATDREERRGSQGDPELNSASRDSKPGEGTFVKGVFILGIGMLAARMMGALYRIPLARMIEAEGMGLYQLAYPIYTAVLIISTGGIPIAISKLISEHLSLGRGEAARDTFRVALTMLAVVGLVFTLGLALSAKLVAALFGDTRAHLALLAISPAIVLVSLMSAFRGYFQGRQNMTPSAVSQVIEQFVRITTILALVVILIPQGPSYAAAGATFGAVAGSGAGLLYLYLVYRRHPADELVSEAAQGAAAATRLTAHEGDVPEPRSRWDHVGRILVLALPISFGAAAVPFMNFIDAAIVLNRLRAAGYAVEAATSLYGQFTGMAMTLINFPTMLAVSLTIGLVPAISEAVALKEWRRVQSRTNLGLRLVMILSLPAAAGLWLLATPITTMLFDDPQAGVPLAVASVVTISIAVYFVTTGILQGLGRTGLPVRNILLGGVMKVITTYTLTGMPNFGIRGAALGTVVGFTVGALLNLVDTLRLTRTTVDWRGIAGKPLVATTGMGVVVFSLDQYAPLSLTPRTLLAIFVGVAVYGALLFATRGITIRDLMMVPGSRKALRFLRMPLPGDDK